LPRKLTRDAQHAVLAGVAAGFGRYLDVDPVLARLGFVLLAFVNGLGVLVYLAGWALMPKGDAAGVSATAGNPLKAEADQKARADAASAQLAIGSVLVVAGALLLAHNLGWLHWRTGCGSRRSGRSCSSRWAWASWPSPGVRPPPERLGTA